MEAEKFSIEKVDQFIVDNKRVIAGLFLLGATYITAKITKSLFSLIRRQILPGYNLLERYGNGSYAAISACTDGIGKGFALELARRGFNLVMFIRNVQKGEQLIQEIKNTINKDIHIKIVEIDFQKVLQPGIVEAAIEQVKDIDISILVNNVGMYLNNSAFETQTTNEILNMISMNVGSQVLLTRHLIAQIRQRSKKGAIINLSSLTSLHPLAGFAIYGATKSFNDYFSQALNEEYKGELDILSVKPGWVATPMTNSFQKKTFEITPEQCASKALKMLGRYSVTYGHAYHEMAAIKDDLFSYQTNDIMRKYTRFQLSNANKANIQQS